MPCVGLMSQNNQSQPFSMHQSFEILIKAVINSLDKSKYARIEIVLHKISNSC